VPVLPISVGDSRTFYRACAASSGRGGIPCDSRSATCFR
jgi:hypothetical protein